jgi:DNA-binding CsgD family transcriptional regulator
MSIDVSFCLRHAPCEPLLEREELVDIVAGIAAEMGADHYLVIQYLAGRPNETTRILISNWVFNALEAVGRDNLATIARSGLASQLGMPARIFGCDELRRFLPEAALEALMRHGHRTFTSQQLLLGQARYGILFSAADEAAMSVESASRAQMLCCYALSQIAPDLIVESTNPLSDRERECLRWVSEGKTTDDVALILGVSSNTVNGYIAHAIQKLSASNRALAMANAIRNGLI